MSDPGELDVVVVNWNTGRYLADCLRSVHASAGRVVLGHVAVVDNASSDDSLARARPWLDRPEFVVVRNRSNAGFAAASNQGARLGQAPLILFLNPDASVLEDTLARVVAFFGSPAARTVGICGGQVLDEAGHPDISGGPFPTPRLLLGQVTGLSRVLPSVFPAKHVVHRAASGPMDHVIGAFLVVRRDLFEQLGGFDERYFLYYEEVDLCLRARALGWATYHLADVEVVHAGRVSSSQIGGRRLAYSLTSRRAYARTHWPRRRRLVLALLTVAVEFPARLLTEAVRSAGLPRETVRGYLGHLRAVQASRHPAADRRHCVTTRRHPCDAS
jgi:N-acetylglucosaminyl-diphospho-decaprenol L-rhamnosyltransferase